MDRRSVRLHGSNNTDDGKYNYELKNHCEFGTPVLPGVFPDILCAVSVQRIVGYGRWDNREENKYSQ